MGLFMHAYTSLLHLTLWQIVLTDIICVFGMAVARVQAITWWFLTLDGESADMNLSQVSGCSNPDHITKNIDLLMFPFKKSTM